MFRAAWRRGAIVGAEVTFPVPTIIPGNPMAANVKIILQSAKISGHLVLKEMSKLLVTTKTFQLQLQQILNLLSDKKELFNPHCKCLILLECIRKKCDLPDDGKKLHCSKRKTGSSELKCWKCYFSKIGHLRRSFRQNSSFPILSNFLLSHFT